MIASAAYRLRAMPTPFAPARILAQDLDRFWGGRSEFLPLQAYRDVMETNFYGPLRCMQALLGHMRERGRGAIINVSSIGAVSVGPLESPYTASKFALEGVTESVALELVDTDVRVALIESGLIATPILDDLPNPPPPEPGSPYAVAIRRGGAFFRSGIPDATAPERVAEVVLDILDGETWKLRNPAGPNAERIFQRLGVERRELPLPTYRLPDPEWAAALSDLYAHNIRV